MVTRNFMELYQAQQNKGNFVCVGLDSDYEKIPDEVKKRTADIRRTLSGFNSDIIDKTKDVAGFYKINSAFYEEHGAEGMNAMRDTVKYAHQFARDNPVILDAKRADIGKTNEKYAAMAFDWANADAITTNPYFGEEALEPLLKRKEKGIIVLCRTSNKGAKEFQDRLILHNRHDLKELFPQEELFREFCKYRKYEVLITACHLPLYQVVAARVANHWNKNGNCLLVTGATYHEEIAQIRNIAGDIPLLIPGIGTQGGDLEKTVIAAKNSKNQGMIINSSSGIIFDPDPRAKTLALHQAIQKTLARC